ncbi:hypothetical protein FS837_002937 [Tulasnella sp. UAMH 9824]|nr:hypothetical protein FS837_002937 [Tulasnella sp. UAMH 9824]
MSSSERVQHPDLSHPARLIYSVQTFNSRTGTSPLRNSFLSHPRLRQNGTTFRPASNESQIMRVTRRKESRDSAASFESVKTHFYEHLPSSIPGRPSPSPVDSTDYELYGEEAPEVAEDVLRARGGVPRLVAFSQEVKIA